MDSIKLPSNKKFGFTFAFLFLILSFYFYHKGSLIFSYIFLCVFILFFIISIIKPDILFFLNKLWIRFGLLLGKIISPFVMGLMFFGLITPISLIGNLIRRDELKLILNKRKSHWIDRDNKNSPNELFEHQF